MSRKQVQVEDENSHEENKPVAKSHVSHMGKHSLTPKNVGADKRRTHIRAQRFSNVFQLRCFQKAYDLWGEKFNDTTELMAHSCIF
jgi:hypothetical protein